MSAQLKEALAALDEADAELASRELCFRAHSKLATVRAALELAARESDAWEAVEAYQKRTQRMLALNPAGNLYQASFGLLPVPENDWHRDTRLDALEAAAAWCRGEMAK